MRLTSAFILVYCMFYFVPALSSIPRVPSSGFFGAVMLVYMLAIGFKYLFNSSYIPIVSFLMLSFFYFLLDNYKSGFDHEDPILAFMSLTSAFLPYHYVVYKRNLPIRDENLLFISILILAGIASITTIRGLLLFPDAARYMVGADSQVVYLQYLRMNIFSYSGLYFFAITGPVLLYFYFKFRLSLGLFIIGILCVIAVFLGQITGILLILVFNVLLLILSVRTKSIKQFIAIGILVLLTLILFRFLLIEILIFISPLLSDFESLSIKFSELIILLSGDGDSQVSTNDQLINTNSYQERLAISWNSFLESPIFGGGRSGAHHYWMDYLAENGIVGLFLWLVFMNGYYRIIKKRPDYEWRVLNMIGIISFISFGISKNIVLSQMALPVFFLYPFLIMKLLDKVKK